MKFEEVLPALRAGKRVRHRSWPEHAWWTNKSAISHNVLDCMSTSAFFDDYWEIEPVKRELSRDEVERAWELAHAPLRIPSSSANGGSTTFAAAKPTVGEFLRELGFEEGE